MKRDRENIRKLITEAGFGEFEDYLMKHARPSIRAYAQRTEDENIIPIGNSKIGGRPDLPQHMGWVTVDKTKEEKGSLPFIAQFKLEDIKPYDEENILPDTGILYFFADPFEVHSYVNFGRVIYFDGDPALLERKEFPEDIPAYQPGHIDRYYPCTTEFVSEVNLSFEVMDKGNFSKYPENKTWEDLVNLSYSASYPPRGLTVNRLLGCNYDVPGDMQLECQLITDVGDPFRASSAERLKAEQKKDDWQLLFQMGSDDNAGMMWSDAGTICFYIRQEDLSNRNFDNICLAFFTS
jgi:uncharacterized protein YwqG